MTYENEVAPALDIVIEEIENVAKGLNTEGAEAFRQGEYETAHELTEKGSQIKAFQDKVKELQKEWHDTFATVITRRLKQEKGRKGTKRLDQGLRSPEDAFGVPILQPKRPQKEPDYINSYRAQLSNPASLPSKIREYIDSLGVVRWNDLKRACVERLGCKSQTSGSIGASVRMLARDGWVTLEGRGEEKRIFSAGPRK
jgi:hypothetical protein